MQRKVFTFELRALISAIVSLNLLFCSSNPLVANPTGGVVAGGSATISGGAGLTTIRQSSNAAVINWQGFSINSNETTRFIQPSSQSATLNRVLGGGTSQINGTLQANGQVYLINQNGIVVGPSGVINAAGGFVGSTRDISDSDFKHNHQHFVGHGGGSVINQGVIQSSLGKVVLIGKTVNNSGTIQARGTAGLVAGDDVLLGQQNADGSTITVNTSPLATSASGQVGVQNSGSIVATAAELKAADGNIYSLAIQNQGSIRASTVSHQGGHIWLTSDSGTIVNTGTLNASSTLAKGKGGTVIMKNMGGLTVDSGKILAKGGAGGVGGNAEVSGKDLQFTGTVDLTAPGGKTGNLLFDPENITIQSGGIPTASYSDGTYTATSDNSIISASELDDILAYANVTVTTGSSGAQQGDITVASPLAWSIYTTLTLNAANNIYLNADIAAPSGGLILNAAKQIVSGNETASGTITANINLSSFYIDSGSWIQNANGGTLPTFVVSNDFGIDNSYNYYGSFLRVEGGTGTTGNPYQITDIYGLQGIGTHSFLGDSFIQNNDIDASAASPWDNGAGFSPIGSFTGMFNGNGKVISGLAINLTGGGSAGLFGSTGTEAIIENVALSGGSVTGAGNVGELVGNNGGTVETSYATGAVTGEGGNDGFVGGLVGSNNGTVKTSYATGAVTGVSGNALGGLVGANGGTLETSYATGDVTEASGVGTGYVGGLVGYTYTDSTIETSYATGIVIAGTGTSYVGGLVGENEGTVESCYATGNVTGGSENLAVGGLVGYDQGTVGMTYSKGNVTGSGTTEVGGLVGATFYNSTVESSYTTGAVTAVLVYSGGLVGANGGNIKTSYWATDASGQKATTIAYNNLGTVDSYSTGKTLAQLELQSTFNPAGTGVPNWDFTNTWTTNGNSTTPLLKALSVTVSGKAVGAGNTIDLISMGNVRYTATANGSGNFSFDLPDNVVDSGILLTDVTSASSADAFYGAGGIPTSPITGLNLTANTLTVEGTGTSNTALGLAAGSLTNKGIDFSVAGSNLTTNSGVGISIVTPYTLDGNLTATNANLTTTTNGTFTGSVPVTLSAKNMNLAGSITSTSTVTLNASGNIIPTGSIQVAGFILQNGNFEEVVGQNGLSSLPTFSASNDFELQNSSSFLRVAGGTGSLGTPYQITDVYGLEGVGSPSGAYLADSFVLKNDIDASGTATWNSGAGFASIGGAPDGDVSAYTGTFNGAGFTISGLTIDLASESDLGLFGFTGIPSTIKNVGLTGCSVTGDNYVGGLVGFSEGTVLSSFVTGSVSGNIWVGGLEGYNDSGTVTSSYSAATVTGPGNVGGLVGFNTIDGTVALSYATGAVTCVSGAYIGGLVGNNYGTIETSHATGAVTGDSSVGGLVGYNAGTESIVTTSYATGAVSGTTSVGGLVGDNANTVSLSYASGAVTGTQYVGGLVGQNSGSNATTEITTSHATGTVTGGSESFYIGGLVGLNANTVSLSYATGAVSGYSEVGGLVGENSSQPNDGATIETSYETGTVNGNSQVGGLVGENYNTVQTSYATGAVNGTTDVGGLIGFNNGNVYDKVETSYATGTVTGSSYVGGLVGINGTAGTIETCYETGAVTGTIDVGALVGLNEALLETSYWATNGGGQNGTLEAYGVNDGTVINTAGLSLALLTQQVSFDGSWDFTNTWTTAGNSTTPLLQALTTVTLSGNTPGALDQVNFIGNGQVLSTTTASGGAFTISVPYQVAENGGLLTDGTGDQSDTFYINPIINSLSLTGVNLQGNTLLVTGGGTASNGLLGSTIGSLSGNGINYSVSGPNLTTKPGVILTIDTPYNLDGNITVTGALTTTSNGALNGTGASVLLTSSSMTLAGTTSNLNTVGVNTGAFILQSGNWVQNTNGATLPTFTASNDFELQGSSSFLRVAGGSGTTGNPYQITDVYGLQGIASPSNAYLGDSFVLNNNINASSTSTWNSGAGFVPIGVSFVISYTGTFNGAGYTISGLTIDQPSSQGYVGLFGVAGSGAVIEDVGLTGESLIGNCCVGGLVGYNEGTVETSYTAGSVTGTGATIETGEAIGGLVGTNYYGTVETSYSSAAVTGNSDVGGLVGLNEDAMVEMSSATGSVSVSYQDAGGLIGLDFGTGNNVEACYSTASVNGTDDIGGLVGYLNGSTISTSYATGAVTAGNGSSYVAGLVADNYYGTVETCYTTSAVTAGTGSQYVAGLVGYNYGTVENSYWAKNGGGQNSGLPTVDINQQGTVTGNSGVTLSQLSEQSTYQPAGTGAGNWDFTLGTGVWGINGVSSSGQINGGLPYFQWQHPTLVQIVANNQTTTYNKTNTGDGFSTTAYAVNLAAGTSSLAGLFATDPTAGVVGSNVDVGTSNTIDITGVPTGNNAFEVVSGTETFSPRPITVTGNSGSSQYGLTPTNPGISVTSGTLAGNDTVSGLGLGDDFSLTGASSAGAYSVNVTGSSNDYALTTLPGTYQITPAPLAVSVVSSGSSIYGNTPVQPGYAITGALYNGDTLSNVVEVSNNFALTGASSAAGYSFQTVATALNNNYTLTFVAGTPGYSAVSETDNWTIAPRPVTIKVNNGTSQYGLAATDPGYGITAGNLVNGDQLSGLVSGDNFSLTSASNAGSSMITAISENPNNYALTLQSGTYTITKAPLTVGINSGGTSQYGLTPVDPGVSVTSGALYNGDTLSSVGVGDTFNLTAASNVGTSGLTVTGFSGLPNYNITGETGSNYIITKAPLTIDANNGTSQYGLSTVNPGISVGTGTVLYNGATLASLGFGDNFTALALSSSSNAGNYDDSVTGPTTLTNYSVTKVGGVYTITKAPLAVTAKNGTSQYGLAPVNPGISLTSGTLYHGATLASLGLGDNFTSLKLTGASNVGTYSDSVTPTTLTNYTVTEVGGTYTITQAPLTVVANNGTSQYGLTPVNPGISVGGGTKLYNGSTLASLLFTSDNFASLGLTSATGAGTYYDTVTLPTTSPANYSVSYVGGTYTISKAPITVTVGSGTSQYGLTPTDPAIKITSGKLYNNDTLSALITAGLGDSFDLTAASSAGTTALTVTGTPDNYKVTGVNGTYTITKAKIDVAVNTGGTSQYGLTPTNPGIELTGGTLYNTDTINSIGLSDNFSLTDASNAGSSTIAVTGTSLDYTYTPKSATYIITKVPLTVAVNSGGTSVYGTTPANPGIAVTYGTLYNGNTLSSLKVGDSFALTSASNAATYILNVTGFSTLANYAVTAVESTFTITQAPLTVMANNGTSQYGTSPVNPGISLAAGTKVYNGSTLTSLGFSDNFAKVGLTSLTDVGAYNDFVTGPTTLTNYAITELGGTYTITQAPLKVVANSGTSQYGLTPVDPGISVGAGTKLYGGLTLSGLGFMDNFAVLVSSDSNVGTYTTVVNGPTSLTNYSLTDVTGTYTITKAPITVTVTSGSSPFGSTPIDPGIKLTRGKLYNNDTLNTIGLGDSFNLTDVSTVGSYILTVTGTPDNYTVKSVNGTYKITN